MQMFYTYSFYTFVQLQCFAEKSLLFCLGFCLTVYIWKKNQLFTFLLFVLLHSIRFFILGLELLCDGPKAKRLCFLFFFFGGGGGGEVFLKKNFLTSYPVTFVVMSLYFPQKLFSNCWRKLFTSEDCFLSITVLCVFFLSFFYTCRFESFFFLLFKDEANVTNCHSQCEVYDIPVTWNTIHYALLYRRCNESHQSIYFRIQMLFKQRK